MEFQNPILVACDVRTLDMAISLLGKIGSHVGGVKIGLEAIYAFGWSEIAQVVRDNCPGLLFLDGKFYDIPNTVKGVTAASHLRAEPDIFNVSGSAGSGAIQEAVRYRGTADVYVVSVLTSMSEEDCQAMHGRPIASQVVYIAGLAKRAGAQGLICSAQHLPLLNELDDLKGLKYITPGIRSPGSDAHDQVQVDTPVNAIRNGAKYLVMGREITESSDPVGTIQRILDDIAAGRGG